MPVWQPRAKDYVGPLTDRCNAHQGDGRSELSDISRRGRRISSGSLAMFGGDAPRLVAGQAVYRFLTAHANSSHGSCDQWPFAADVDGQT
jgi:hypothetical protein